MQVFENRLGCLAAAARAAGLAQFLLPVCKACGTDAGLEVANLALQVFGGYGYIADTGVEKIDIEDDGSVFITSLDGISGDKAKQIVENLTKEVRVGETYLGTVTRIIAIGAFVQILPGKEGLVHISQLAPNRVEKVEDVVKVGDEVMVKVMEVDGQGRLNLSRKALLGGGSGNGDFVAQPPRTPREPREAAETAGAAAAGPGAPPMRRRRRPRSRNDE